MGLTARTAPPRVQLRAGGKIFTTLIATEVVRDLKEVSGSFHATLFDPAREDAASQALGLPLYGPAAQSPMLVCGMPASILIDEAPVMTGYITSVETDWTGEGRTTRITGMDRAGDLVKCAAVPLGPAEFKNIDLLAFATIICKPFGIPVRADVDVGAPFVRLAVAPAENAMPAIEKAARQRSVLVLSDGVGGLLLTQGGITRAPAPLRVGDWVQKISVSDSWEERFSDVFVKGQTEKCLGARAGVPAALDSTVRPLGGPARPAPPIAPEASAILMTGHATDPAITRWRPHVRLTRTQSGMSSTQEQAEWVLRVGRGQARKISVTVLDWRAPEGSAGALWQPNAVTAVYDPYSGINEDMLIAGVKYSFSAEGLTTQMSLVGVTAFDRIDEAAKHRPKTARRHAAALNNDAEPLEEP